MSTDPNPARAVPDGFKPHTESSTTILVPKGNTAFLNPVQQYNRDLSIAVIRAWNEMRKEEAVVRHELKMQRQGNSKRSKKRQQKGKEAEEGKIAAEGEGGDVKDDQPEAGPSKPVSLGRTLLACGLQLTLEAVQAEADYHSRGSVSYRSTVHSICKGNPRCSVSSDPTSQLPGMRKSTTDTPRVVLANDLSPSACEAMRMNVAYNDAGKSDKPVVEEPSPEEQAMNVTAGVGAEAGAGNESESSSRRRPGCEGFVHVNENDAWSVWPRE